MDFETYLKQKIKYDFDLFVDKNKFEIFFTKEISTKKMFEYVSEIFKKDNIKYHILLKNARKFIFKLKDKQLTFIKSEFI